MAEIIETLAPPDGHTAPPATGKEGSVAQLRQARDAAVAERDAATARLAAFAPFEALLPKLDQLTPLVADLGQLPEQFAAMTAKLATQEETLRGVSIQQSELFQERARAIDEQRGVAAAIAARTEIVGLEVRVLNAPYVDALLVKAEATSTMSLTDQRAHMAQLATQHGETPLSVSELREVYQAVAAIKVEREAQSALASDFERLRDERQITTRQREAEVQAETVRTRFGMIVTAVDTHDVGSDLAEYATPAVRAEVKRSIAEFQKSPSPIRSAEINLHAALVPALLAEIARLKSGGPLTTTPPVVKGVVRAGADIW